jgi:hypothetical protein
MNLAVWISRLYAQTSSEKNISNTRPLPFAVHDSCVVPVDSLDFFHKCPHGVSPVSRALERADDFVLTKVRTQLIHSERQRINDETVDVDGVHFAIYMWNRSVVPVKSNCLGSEETVVSDQLWHDGWYVQEYNEVNRISLRNNTYRSTKVLTGGSLLSGFCVEHSSFLIFPGQDIIKFLEQLQLFASAYSPSKNCSSTWKFSWLMYSNVCVHDVIGR